MHEPERIGREVREFLAGELGRTLDNVDDRQSLLEAGVIDSLAVLSLVGFIERRYGIAVTDDELMPENFENVLSIATFIAGRQGAGVE